MSLLRMGKVVKQPPDAVIARAVTYFGADGVGLLVARRSETEVHLTGGGGHVQVTATPRGDGRETEVDIQTRDWEYDVKRFIQRL